VAESRLAVYGAIAANVAIAVTKFIAAGITGSSSMLSEGIHSVVDTGNDVLLLVGLKRSERPASGEHPFGHGKELYFWTLIVGVLIFGVGGGVSFYEGVLHDLHPAPLEDPKWNYVVLACAFVFEGLSFAMAWRQFARERGERPFWRALRTSKDPSTFTVIAEDGAALAGLLLAALGVYASHRFDRPELDGVASMAIGVLLALLLIRESRGLLVGEGLPPVTARKVRERVAARDGVLGAGPVRSMYVGPDDLLVTLHVQVDTARSGSDLAALVEELKAEVRQLCPEGSHIYVDISEAAVAR
jgi:cation diffusion facilitator family transporter